ncbi:MAG: NACHT domain-containing protein [Chloroflexota bacterium]
MNRRRQEIEDQLTEHYDLRRDYEEALLLTDSSDVRKRKRIRAEIEREEEAIARLQQQLADDTARLLPSEGMTAACLAEYQAWVRREHDQIQVLGMNRPLPLSSLYTDVWLRDRKSFLSQYVPDALETNFREWRGRERQDDAQRQNGLTLAQQEKRLFVMGQPGAGKTTFMRYLALQAAVGETTLPPLPIFVRIREMADSGLELLDYLLREVQKGCRAAEHRWLEQQLDNGQVLVLLDGLDEASRSDGDRKRMRWLIEDFGSRYQDCQIVVTCRVAATSYDFRRFAYVEVADFTETQVKTFVENWFAESEPEKGEKMLQELKDWDQQGIAELTKTPLLLTLLCMAYGAEGKFSPKRATLYEQAFDLLLAEWDKRREIERGEDLYGKLSVGRRQALLSRIAYETFRDGDYFIAQERITGLLLDYLEGVTNMPERIDIDEQKLLESIRAQHGVFVERAYQTFAFAHLTFQEYFAAKYIVENTGSRTLVELMQHVGEDRWREVFLLVASLLPNSEAFFELFLQALTRSIAANSKLVTLLQWANRATNYESLVGQRPAAIRSWYLGLARPRVHDLNRASDLAFTFDLSRDLSSALCFGRNRSSVRSYLPTLVRGRDLASARRSYLIRDLDYTLGRDQDMDLVLDGTLVILAIVAIGYYPSSERAQVADLLPSFQQFMEKVAGIASQLQLNEIADKLRQQPWPTASADDTAWSEFTANLQDILRKRGFIPHKDLSKEQWKMLDTYLQGNQLLLECLDLATVPNRSTVEDRMLLPPSPVAP